MLHASSISDFRDSILYSFLKYKGYIQHISYIFERHLKTGRYGNFEELELQSSWLVFPLHFRDPLSVRIFFPLFAGLKGKSLNAVV